MKALNILTAVVLLNIAHPVKAAIANKPGTGYPPVSAHHKPVKTYDKSVFFALRLTNGEQIGNIFSRAIAYQGMDFKPVVQRVSGTSVYTVIDNDPEKPVFSSTYVYDGHPAGASTFQITGNGSKVSKPGSKSVRIYSDGSGIMYNSLIWGDAPQKIYTGETWEVNIAIPWELGGPGKQTVRVLQTDTENHTITLEREGYSDGFYQDDEKELDIKKDSATLHVQLSPGKSHWRGYTIIKNGLIVSDELMVMRKVTMTNGTQQLDGTEREYFLLNQMPVFDE